MVAVPGTEKGQALTEEERGVGGREGLALLAVSWNREFRGVHAEFRIEMLAHS